MLRVHIRLLCFSEAPGVLHNMGLLMLVSMLVLRGAELSGSASFGVVSQIKFSTMIILYRNLAHCASRP